MTLAASTTTDGLAGGPGSRRSANRRASVGGVLFPKTAHAAAEFAAGGCYVSAVGKQTFTVTHANNAQADRTFFYLAIG